MAYGSTIVEIFDAAGVGAPGTARRGAGATLCSATIARHEKGLGFRAMLRKTLRSRTD